MGQEKQALFDTRARSQANWWDKITSAFVYTDSAIYSKSTGLPKAEIITPYKKCHWFSLVLICFDSIQIFFGEIASLNLKVSLGHQFLTEVKKIRFGDFSSRSFKFFYSYLVFIRVLVYYILYFVSLESQ